MGGFDENCALADGEFGGCDEGVEVWVRVDLGPGVGMLGGELGAGGPGLAAGGDVLAWVLWSLVRGCCLSVLGGVGFSL